MEQTPSLPGRSPELPSVSPFKGEESRGGISSQELAPGQSAEREEHKGAAHLEGQAASQPPIILPLPVSPLPVADEPAATPPIATSPSVASDDDLIEKEWVERAKKLLDETKDDPYRREQEVSRLQADYLLKRYGRELGALRDN